MGWRFRLSGAIAPVAFWQFPWSGQVRSAEPPIEFLLANVPGTTLVAPLKAVMGFESAARESPTQMEFQRDFRPSARTASFSLLVASASSQLHNSSSDARRSVPISPLPEENFCGGTSGGTNWKIVNFS
jgi:hypothetical protein